MYLTDQSLGIRRRLFPRKLRVSFARIREVLFTCVLLIQLVILFVLPNAHAEAWALPHSAVHGILLSFVLLIALLSRSRWALAAVILSLSIAIFGFVGRNTHSGWMVEDIRFLGQILTQLSLFWIVSTAVFGPGRITPHRIVGVIVLYLCIGMIFADIYMCAARNLPGAFANVPPDDFALRQTMTYFSLSALTTCNFGDIVPHHPIVRSLTNIEAIVGQLFAPIFIARIIRQYEGWKEKKRVLSKIYALRSKI